MANYSLKRFSLTT